MLRRLETVPGESQGPALYGQALILTGLGRPDRALDSLEACFQQHAPPLVWLKIEPRFRPLHHEPRFAALLNGLGLASS